MTIVSTVEEFPPDRLEAILADLPTDSGYRLEVTPLRYRTKPHLQALCDWANKAIKVRVPQPFRPFRERVPVLFRTKTEVIRYLYCHEYYHYYLHDVLGRKGLAETACDRFALENFRRRKR
ncbi:MAG: hypothetical protein ACLQCB_02195 [Spirochaetia bacterium]